MGKKAAKGRMQTSQITICKGSRINNVCIQARHSLVFPMLLHICLSVFSRHSREGGNPFFDFKDNGFPITTSGMTINRLLQDFFCKGIYDALH